MAFRTKLILLLASLLLAQGLYLGTLTLRQSQESLRSALQRGAAQVALGLADEIARIVGAADKVLELGARGLMEEVPGGDPARLRSALRALDETHLTLERLLLVDRTGRVLAASFTGAPPSVAGDPALLLALDQNAIGPLLTRDRESSPPTLRIARPVRGSRGEVVGALLGILELTEIADAMRGVSIGKTGSLYLVDREGEVLAVADRNPPGEQTLHLEAAREAARLTLRGVRELEIPGREPLIGAYAAVVGTGWTLAVQQTAGEAYLPAARLQRRILVATGLAVLVAAILAGGLGTWLTRPIRRLTTRVRAVTRPEDLAAGFSVPGQDEVAQLSAALTRMAELILSRDREIRQRNRELEALNTVITAVGRTLDLDRILETALETVMSILPVDACHFRVLDPGTDELVLRAHRGRGERFVRERARMRWQDSPLAREAAARGEHICISDITADPRGVELYARKEGLKAFAMFPLVAETGPVGLLCVCRREVRPFSAQEFLLLNVLGGQVGMAIDSARLYGDLQASTARLGDTNRRLAELYRLTIALQEAIPLGERLDLILQGAHEVLGLDRIGIFLPDPEGGTLECRAILGATEDPLATLRVPVGPEGGAIALAYREARGVVWEGPGPVPPEYRMPGPAAAIRSFRSRAFAILPLVSRGRAIGVLVADNKVSGRPLPQDTLDLLRVFSQQVAIALENARLYAELKGSTEHLEESRRNLEELHRLSIAIQEAASLEERLAHILRGAHEILALDWINIFLPDEGRTALRCVARVGGGEEPLAALTVPLGPAGGGLARAFLEKVDVGWNGEGPVPEALRLHPPYAHLKPLRARIFVNIPLVARGEAIGVIAAGNPETRRPIREETRSLLRIFAGHAAIAIENTRLYQSLKEHSATLEQRIAERTKELAEASRQKSRFLASMSHELRTPLHAILGFSEVLLDRFAGDLTPKQVEHVESIHASGKHLLGLINDLLDLSKIEAGKMVLHPEPCDLPQTLEDALTLVRSEAIRKGVGVGLEVAPEVGLIEADPAKLKQILYNLLSNAIKFTPEGGRVTVQGRYLGSLVEVAVADTGIGIRPEDQKRIFGEFEQVDSAYARQVQGTGLGLPLTRRLVELHGGTLTLQSADGKGSTFTFTLPLRLPLPARA